MLNKTPGHSKWLQKYELFDHGQQKENPLTGEGGSCELNNLRGLNLCPHDRYTSKYYLMIISCIVMSSDIHL